MTTAGDVLAALEGLCPLALAEEGDNVGLLLGDAAMPVTGGLVCLDVTPDALAAAQAAGANLLVSHHALIFRPARRFGGLVYEAARRGLAAIAMHTNLDAAAGGVNDVLAARLGLRQVRQAGALCRVGELPQALDAAAFAAHVEGALHTRIRRNRATPTVKRVAVCGGGGWEYAAGVADADALVVGEMKHHEWLEAAERAALVVEAGHYATEAPVVSAVTAWLTAHVPAVRWTAWEGACPYV